MAGPRCKKHVVGNVSAGDGRGAQTGSFFGKSRNLIGTANRTEGQTLQAIHPVIKQCLAPTNRKNGQIAAKRPLSPWLAAASSPYLHEQQAIST